MGDGAIKRDGRGKADRGTRSALRAVVWFAAAMLALELLVGGKLGTSPFPYVGDARPRVDRFAWSVPTPGDGPFALCLGHGDASPSEVALRGAGCTAFLALRELGAESADDLQVRIERDPQRQWRVTQLSPRVSTGLRMPRSSEYTRLDGVGFRRDGGERVSCGLSRCVRAEVVTDLPTRTVTLLRELGPRGLGGLSGAQSSGEALIRSKVTLSTEAESSRVTLRIDPEAAARTGFELELDAVDHAGVFALSPRLGLAVSSGRSGGANALRCAAGGCVTAGHGPIICQGDGGSARDGCGGVAVIPAETRSFHLRLGRAFQVWLPREHGPLVIVRNRPLTPDPAPHIAELRGIRSLRLPDFGASEPLDRGRSVLLERSRYRGPGVVEDSPTAVIRLTPGADRVAGKVAIDAGEQTMHTLHRAEQALDGLLAGRESPPEPASVPRWRDLPVVISQRLGPRPDQGIGSPRELFLLWRPDDAAFFSLWERWVRILLAAQLAALALVLAPRSPFESRARATARLGWFAVATCVAALLWLASRHLAVLCVHSRLLQAESFLGKHLLALNLLLPAGIFAATLARWWDARCHRTPSADVFCAVVRPTAGAAAYAIALRLALHCVDAPAALVHGMSRPRAPWTGTDEAAVTSQATLIAALALCVVVVALTYSTRARDEVRRRFLRPNVAPVLGLLAAFLLIPRILDTARSLAAVQLVRPLGAVGVFAAALVLAWWWWPQAAADRAIRSYLVLGVGLFVLGAATGGWVQSSTGASFKLSELVVGLLSIAFGYAVESTLGSSLKGHASSDRGSRERQSTLRWSIGVWLIVLPIVIWVRLMHPRLGFDRPLVVVTLSAATLAAVGFWLLQGAVAPRIRLLLSIMAVAALFSVLYFLLGDLGPAMTLFAACVSALIFMSLDSDVGVTVKTHSVGIGAVVLACVAHLSVALLEYLAQYAPSGVPGARSLSRIDCYRDMTASQACEQWVQGLWLVGRASRERAGELTYVAALHHDLAFDSITALWGHAGAVLVLLLGATVAALLLVIGALPRERGATSGAHRGGRLLFAAVCVVLVLLFWVAGGPLPLQLGLGVIALLLFVQALVSFVPTPGPRDGLKSSSRLLAVAAPVALALFWTFAWATHVASNLMLFLPTGVVLPFVSYSGFAPTVWVAAMASVASLSLTTAPRSEIAPPAGGEFEEARHEP